jgi:signal transduction histidine kinase
MLMKRKTAVKSNIFGENIALFFSVFLDNLNNVVIYLDNEDKIKALNHTAELYFKNDRSAIIGHDYSSVEKNSELLQRFAKVKKSNENTNTKFTINPSNDNEDFNLPIEWSFLTLSAYDITGYLIIGNILTPKQYNKIQDEKIENYLKDISSCMPGNFYWKDKNGRYLGCNQAVLTMMKYKDEKELIGKTDYDLWPEQADELQQHDAVAMASDKPVYLEETLHVKGRDPMFFTVIKMPLKDANGNVIGIIGNSLNITASKEAESLKLENERQRVKLEEQERFLKDVDQLIHDIRSPLASLLMIVKACEKDIPETARIALREASISIGDIANNLLDKYKQEDDAKHGGVEKQQLIIVSLALLSILTDKKYQYQNLSVNFEYEFCPTCNFVFLNIELSSFNRMVSNLINNAVDALEGKSGTIILKLDAGTDWLKITIQDNGKGMSEELISKIIQNAPIASDKVDGHGIGLTQVREALQRNKGKLAIASKIGRGTEIVLTFPRAESPVWLASEILLNVGDTIVILDDDSSIHGAWKTRLNEYEKQIKVQHFTNGEEAISFVNNFADKDKIFLLTDFELLKQELNGIHIINRTDIKRAILVTSHYNNAIVQDLARKANTKILPKQLASETPIIIQEQQQTIATQKSTQVDLVVIDDNKLFTNSLLLMFDDKIVETYNDPDMFLNNLEKYPKDTKICTDNDLRSHINGLQLAEQLHKAGFTNLYLLSGTEFASGEVPAYLKVILKSHTEEIIKLI